MQRKMEKGMNCNTNKGRTALMKEVNSAVQTQVQKGAVQRQASTVQTAM